MEAKERLRQMVQKAKREGWKVASKQTGFFRDDHLTEIIRRLTQADILRKRGTKFKWAWVFKYAELLIEYKELTGKEW